MRSRYGTNVAFLDMTLNVLLGVSAMFIIAFLLIREEDKKITDLPEPPVQIMVTLQWPVEGAAADADLDLWVAWGNNDQDAVGFRSPSREGIALERDDLGNRSDRYIVKGLAKEEVIKVNREVINFRRLPSEEITVNTMFYYANDKYLQVPCTVQVYKLNPFSLIYEGSTVLSQRGQEHTFVRFKVDTEGQVHGVHNRPKSIVYAKPATSTQEWPESSSFIGSPSSGN